MWENLKIGLKRCPLRTKSKMFFLLFCLCSVVSFSQSLALNEEDLTIVETLTPEAMMNIIRMQNQQIIEFETTFNLVDQGLMGVLILLKESDRKLILAGSDNNLLKNQLAMLSTTHRTEKKEAYENGFKTGITIGSISGGIFSGTIAIGLSQIE